MCVGYMQIWHFIEHPWGPGTRPWGYRRMAVCEGICIGICLCVFVCPGHLQCAKGICRLPQGCSGPSSPSCSWILTGTTCDVEAGMMGKPGSGGRVRVMYLAHTGHLGGLVLRFSTNRHSFLLKPQPSHGPSSLCFLKSCLIKLSRAADAYLLTSRGINCQGKALILA